MLFSSNLKIFEWNFFVLNCKFISMERISHQDGYQNGYQVEDFRIEAEKMFAEGNKTTNKVNIFIRNINTSFLVGFLYICIDMLFINNY